MSKKFCKEDGATPGLYCNFCKTCVQNFASVKNDAYTEADCLTKELMHDIFCAQAFELMRALRNETSEPL